MKMGKAARNRAKRKLNPTDTGHIGGVIKDGILYSTYFSTPSAVAPFGAIKITLRGLVQHYVDVIRDAIPSGGATQAQLIDAQRLLDNCYNQDDYWLDRMATFLASASCGADYFGFLAIQRASGQY